MADESDPGRHIPDFHGLVGNRTAVCAAHYSRRYSQRARRTDGWLDVPSILGNKTPVASVPFSKPNQKR